MFIFKKYFVQVKFSLKDLPQQPALSQCLSTGPQIFWSASLSPFSRYASIIYSSSTNNLTIPFLKVW